MASISLTSSAPIYSSTNRIPSTFDKLCKAITNFVFFVFKVLFQLFNGKFQAAYWECQNKSYQKEIPAFWLSSPSYYSSAEDFSEISGLIQEFQQLKGIDNNQDLKKIINDNLHKGFCHAECLELVRLVKETHGSLGDQIEKLKTSEKNLAQFQMLEDFRFCFAENKKQELLEKIQDFLPNGLSHETTYCLDEKTHESSIKEDLQKMAKGLVIVRLYNQTSCHSVVMEIDFENQRFGFYNNRSFSGGHYEYQTFDAFVSSFIKHVETHTIYNQKNRGSFWNLSFYPEEII